MAKKKAGKSRVRNWSEYNKSLMNRGKITIWIKDTVVGQWQKCERTGKRGHPRIYSDHAIELMATLQAVCKLALRQTQGLVQDIFETMKLSIPVPHFTTLSERKQTLNVRLAKHPAAARHIVIDSTGVKVFGEGEWKVRQHGPSKRRTWKKLHIGVDEANGEIVAMEVTDNSQSDCEMLPSLLDQIDAPIKQVSADKAYDRRKCYAAIHTRRAKATIPPKKRARIWQHGNSQKVRLDRDENLRCIRRHGIRHWKKVSGYHRRSIAETAFSRFKRIFGPTISARTFAGQTTEIQIRCKILNQLLAASRANSN